MPSSAETFSVRLPDGLKAEVDALAKLTKRSRSFIVKEAVAAYMEDRRDYLQAVDEALVEADRGVFVSGAKAFEWLDALAKGSAPSIPDPDILGAKKQ